MKYKIGYYPRTDIQHLPPIIRIYKHLGGLILTKNEDIYHFIQKHYPKIFDGTILVKNSTQARKIAWENDLKIIIYTGFQMINWGYSIQVFHGVSDKNYLEDKRIQKYDLLLLPGQKHLDKLKRSQLLKNPKKFSLVGYPKFDDLINENIKTSSLFNNEKSTILYAPTWISHNKGDKINYSKYRTSSLPLWWKPLIRQISQRWNLIIKYHSRINKNRTRIYDEIDEFVGTSNLENSVKIVWDADITKYMKLADILISDISAVCYEWFHLNKPIIFANPEPGKYRPSLNIFSNTYAWQAGDVLNKEEDIETTIEKNLDKDEYNNVRNELLHYSFYKPDGQATKRQISEILKLYKSASSRSKLFIFFRNIGKLLSYQ